MENKTSSVCQWATLLKTIEELGFALNTRGSLSFIRDLIELYHSHLYLVNAVVRGDIEEAKECADCDLERSIEQLFLIQQVADVLVRVEDVERCCRLIAKE